jgi:hypothetical protein
MPFSPADRPVARRVSTEAEKFAKLFRKVPVVKGWPDHKAVRPMFRAFRDLNKALATRDRRGYVSVAAQSRMGRAFQKIGAAMLSANEKRGRTRRRTAAAKRRSATR